MSPDVSQGRMFQREELQMQRPPGKAREPGEEWSQEESERYGQVGKERVGVLGCWNDCHHGVPYSRCTWSGLLLQSRTAADEG